MKTLALGLLLGFTSLTFSQNEIAFVDLNSTTEFELKTSKTTSNNESFINCFSFSDISKRILSFQRISADYNIKSDPIYTPNQPSTYTVIFKEANNKIINLYSHNGEILNSDQTYSKIRLPHSISSNIAKEYPGWSISDIACTITYIKGKDVTIVYKVKLKNGKLNRSLKIIG